MNVGAQGKVWGIEISFRCVGNWTATEAWLDQ